MRSIARQGTTLSSDADYDIKRADASVEAYFTDRRYSLAAMRGPGSDSIELVRLDAATQRIDTVATLRHEERKLISARDNVVVTQSVRFSPADGWGG